MQLKGQKIVVVGLGISGMSAAEFLIQEGADVWVSDFGKSEQVVRRAEQLKSMGAQVVFGPHSEQLLLSADAIVLSPGVPFHPVLAAAEKKGVFITNEIELASERIQSPIIGITGTNGKSTVTTWVGQILQSSNPSVFVGGNLGTPLIESLKTSSANHGTVVAELSSFQLERTHSFAPRISVILNIDEDHLDRYASLDAYAKTKARIFEYQTSTDHLVVPANDPMIEKLLSKCKAQIHTFGGDLGEDQVGEVRIEEGCIFDEVTGLQVSIDELQMMGTHNYLNACATALICRLAGVEPTLIEKGLRAFRGLPHRMYRVAEQNEVTFYDDSKATNVHAAVTALKGLGHRHEKAVLIAGGKDKGGSYLPLRKQIEQSARAVVLIGESRSKMQEAFQGMDITCVEKETLQEAVMEAVTLASPGDAVLLAPACASFDMFDSYVHRGEVFQKAVEALEHSTASKASSKNLKTKEEAYEKRA